jgi:hypothetical protein
VFDREWPTDSWCRKDRHFYSGTLTGAESSCEFRALRADPTPVPLRSRDVQRAHASEKGAASEAGARVILDWPASVFEATSRHRFNVRPSRSPRRGDRSTPFLKYSPPLSSIVPATDPAPCGSSCARAVGTPPSPNALRRQGSHRCRHSPAPTTGFPPLMPPFPTKVSAEGRAKGALPAQLAPKPPRRNEPVNPAPAPRKEPKPPRSTRSQAESKTNCHAALRHPTP